MTDWQTDSGRITARPGWQWKTLPSTDWSWRQYCTDKFSSDCKSTNHSAIIKLFVGCLTSSQHASASQGQICSGNSRCCHTETEVVDQTFHLTQSQCTDTRPTSPSADPVRPFARQGSHCSTKFQLTGMSWPGKRSTDELVKKNPWRKQEWNQGLRLSRQTPYH